MTGTVCLEDATWHRLNPRMLLIHPIVEIGRALPALVGVFIAGRTQGNHYWGLAAAGVVAGLAVMRWFTTRLRITADSVQLRRGLLHRQTITTARDRIRTVDITSHPLHRMLGLARVVVGTGLNDRKGTGRLVLDGLTVEAATRLRNDLLHRTPAIASGAIATVRLEDEIARLDPRWIRYAPFTLSGVVTGLVIWGFYWRVAGESGIDLARTGPLRTVRDTLEGMPTAVAVLVVVVAVVLFVAVTSTAGYVLAFWRFRLVRLASGTTQVTRGLLTTRATSIERRRLVGVALAEPLPLRMVGAARSTAIATGLRTGRGAERGGEVLLPPAPRGAALAVATRVLNGTTAVRAPVREHGRAARTRRLVRALLSGAVVTAGAVGAWSGGAPTWLLAVGAAAGALCVPLGLDRYRNLGHTVDDGYLVTSSGSIVRRRAVLHRDAVIGWNLRSTWFQRRAGLVSLSATTAAGRQGYLVRDVAVAEALSLADAVTPGLLASAGAMPRSTASHISAS